MILKKQQLNSYHKNGFLIIENQFSPEEIALLKREMTKIAAIDRPGRVLETSGAVRTVFAPHSCNQFFQTLAQVPRLIEPAQQILKSEVYIHQYKLNAKVAFNGERWEWHQDFLYWHKEDSMPEPRALNVVVFLEDVNDFNGPLLVIPGSHRKGMIDLEPNQSGWKSTLTSDLKYKINKQILTELLEDSNIFAIKGKAGFVLLFHCNLFHASASNLSPWDRFSAFITYNSIENTLPKIDNPRPNFIASRDFNPIKKLSDDALMKVRTNRFNRSKENNNYLTFVNV